MADARFNCIAILDAIPTGEFNTARRLREQLLDIRLTVPSNVRLDIRYFRIETVSDLEAAFESLNSEAIDTGLIPWLHLEGHGATDESGFLTAHGMPCSWRTLKGLVTPINVATRLNVVLLLATCFGGSFAREIRADDRAPVLGLIGPTHEVTAGACESDFQSLYKQFFLNNSIAEAVQALESNGRQYFVTTAKSFFLAVWRDYRLNHCSPQRLDVRARELKRRAKAQGLSRMSMGAFKRQLKRAAPESFAKARHHYFMCDLYPDHRLRFATTFSGAEAFARSGFASKADAVRLPHRTSR